MQKNKKMNPRAKGMRFEAKVRADLEKKGWIVSKWQNNVELNETILYGPSIIVNPFGKNRLIPARQGRYRLTSTGFPDFICFIKRIRGLKKGRFLYEIMGLECKSNGYLSKEEKFKCRWLLDNNIFSKILIAKKGKKRGEIIYEEFKWKDM